MELMRGLVQLAVEKLYSDIPNLQFDDFVFSHCIDEALGFDRELRETYNYPSTQSSILAVLTQASVFVKWMNMERKCKETTTTSSILASKSMIGITEIVQRGSKTKAGRRKN